MHTLSHHDDLPPEQLDQLDELARTAPTELRDVLMSVSRCLREGAEIVAFDPTTTITPSQAAERLGMSRTHLYKLLDRGDMPSHRVGRDRRIVVADLIAFEEARQASRRQLAERFAHQKQTERAVIDEIADLL